MAPPVRLMENHIPQQAAALAAAAGLGVAGAVLYDLLRSVRLRRRRSRALTHALDGLYTLAAATLTLWLALGLGGGQLRLYMICGAAARALGWWLWPGRLLRPVWDFWAECFAAFFAALGWPFRQLWRGMGALWALFLPFGKKTFSFAAKWFTIKDTELPEEGQPMKKTRRKANPLLIAVLLVLVAVLAVETAQVYRKLSYARQEQASLAAQVEQQTQANDALKADLSKAGDENFIKGLARELLGLAESGERIFYDVND
ncbi:MAG: septum formation initiator family protein [Oscillospiraceae bacterium]|nr:septum formation initiator family protein [Oscillospiraceae bacterium]